jgi:hypothetical protein
MPYTIGDRQPMRLPGDFVVAPVPGYAPPAAEAAYLQKLNDVLQRLADEEADDATNTDTAQAALVEARRRLRSRAVADLRSDAEAFRRGLAANGLAPEIAADNALVVWGGYAAGRDRLAGSLFVVRERLNPQNTLAVELLITVAIGLRPPDDRPSQEKQALFVALNSALTVVRTVCERMQDRAGSWLHRQLGMSAREAARADRILDEYVRKLAGIGRLGLEGPHVQLANLALDGLKSEFVTAEAGRIKNTYIVGLGLAAGVAALVFLVIYVGIQLNVITFDFWVLHKAFLLAAMGAALGTWLSFSIRRVTLSFNDLAMLEEDLLDPSIRVAFVVSLTLIACLLFWTGATNIEIGNLKTSHFAGATAFLVGAFAGLSERALATAISGRAAAFIKGLGGA